jgi:uncharacterized damage-inducible protein DinB
MPSTMTADDARRLFAFNVWANRRLLDAARSVPPSDFARDLGSSFGSIGGTLLHIMSGEWKWLQYWLGRSYEREFRADDYPDVAALEAGWATVWPDQEAFVASLTEERLESTSLVRGAQRPLSDTLQHLLNHSSHHRGQVSTMLRQVGRTPPGLDFLVYLVEAS